MSLENDLRELGRIPLFAAMEYEALRLIAFAGEAHTVVPLTTDVTFVETVA